MSRFTLTDDQVAEIRSRAASGASTVELADRFDVSKQHISRLVRGEQRPILPAVRLDGPSVTAAVRAHLGAAELVAEEDVRAATAIALAEKLDGVRASSTAQAAMAAAGLARALAEVLDELDGRAGASGPRLGRLRGDEAVLVARELGYPDPESVDVDRFDELQVIVLRRLRRLAAMRGGAV